MKVKIYFIAFIMATGCHCAKKYAEQKPADEKKVQEVSDAGQSLNNLVVSFYSKGSGINREAAGKLEKFLSGYIGKTNTPVTWKRTGWGREGETDYCISLSGMNTGQRDKFIAEIKDLLRSAETVHLFENRPCREIK